MNNHIPSRAAIFGMPIHVMLVPFPVVCFIGALLTDIAYAQTAQMQWANFSAWLLAFGIGFAVLASIAGLIDFLQRPVRSMMAAWLHAGGNLVVLVLAAFNNFVHSRDAWTSVVPTGLILSALTVLVMLGTGALGGYLVHHRGVGVAR